MNSLFKDVQSNDGCNDTYSQHIHNTGAFKKSHRVTFSLRFSAATPSGGHLWRPLRVRRWSLHRLQTTSTATALLAGAVRGHRGHILATGKSWIGSPTFGGTENGLHVPYENGTFPYENGTFSL